MEWLDELAGAGVPAVARPDGEDLVVATWRDGGGRTTATATVLLDGAGVLDWLVLRDERSGGEVHCPGDAVGLDAATAAVAATVAGAGGFSVPPGQPAW